MKASGKILIAVVAGQFLSESLVAGTINTQFVPVDNSRGGAALADFVTSDLQVTVDADWNQAGIIIDLQSGSIYQESIFGADITLRAPTEAEMLLRRLPFRRTRIEAPVRPATEDN